MKCNQQFLISFLIFKFITMLITSYAFIIDLKKFLEYFSKIIFFNKISPKIQWIFAFNRNMISIDFTEC